MTKGDTRGGTQHRDSVLQGTQTRLRVGAGLFLVDTLTLPVSQIDPVDEDIPPGKGWDYTKSGVGDEGGP